jgi:hypothetical protein
MTDDQSEAVHTTPAGVASSFHKANTVANPNAQKTAAIVARRDSRFPSKRESRNNARARPPEHCMDGTMIIDKEHSHITIKDVPSFGETMSTEYAARYRIIGRTRGTL